MHFPERIFLFLILTVLSSCQLMPQGPRDIVAPGLEFSSIQTDKFYLLIATNQSQDKSVLHVYIEGDGTPWVNRYFIAKDPGPYGRLSLDLMQQDFYASLYLGRPCYYSWRLPQQKNCSPLLWTDARYSRRVVDAMASALQNFLNQKSFEKVNLIGHSGGGTLAYLIAQEVESVSGLIIISGNLDTDAWTKHHHYTKMRSSINPTKLPMRRNLPVIYLAGGKDEVVPLELNEQFLQSINAKIIVRPSYDHVCCWRNEWRQLIPKLANDL